MKKTSFFREAMLLVTIVTTTFLIASCGYNQKTTDTKEVAEDQNDENFDNYKQERDAQFLVNAAEIDLEQIQLAQLAQQNGKTTHVKELGKMMEDAHTKSFNDLTVLANSKMIIIPNSATNNAQDVYKKLNDESGNDFDKAYADMMVNEHKDAIAAFEKASTDSYDTDIQNWATISLIDLRKHLEHSIACKEECDKMYSQK